MMHVTFIWEKYLSLSSGASYINLIQTEILIFATGVSNLQLWNS